MEFKSILDSSDFQMGGGQPPQPARLILVRSQFSTSLTSNNEDWGLGFWVQGSGFRVRIEAVVIWSFISSLGAYALSVKP